MEDVDIMYENAVIYMMKHKTDDKKEFYIGSSTDFKKRCWGHKSNCNNQNSKQYNYKLYKYMRENGGWDCWEMLLLYDYPCKNRNELHLEEQRAVKEYKSTLNQFIPARTYQERYKDNREKILQQRKEYRKNNKEKILQKNKERYENNREKYLQYYKNNKERYEANKKKILQKNKERYENNREKYLQQSKEYYESNKEKLKIKINCDICNAIVCKREIARHKRSEKCKNYS